MLQGLDGVEGIHSSHSKTYAEKVMSWARENGLLMTGGSDFHKMNTDGTELGCGGDGEVEKVEGLDEDWSISI